MRCGIRRGDCNLAIGGIPLQRDKNAQILIVIGGGVVQGAFVQGDAPVECAVLDLDVEESQPGDGYMAFAPALKREIPESLRAILAQCAAAEEWLK